MPDEQKQRGQPCRRRKQGVLKRPEAQHARSRLPTRESGPFQRGPIERKTPALNEHAEPGRDHHGGLRHVQLRATLNPSYLPVRERVSEISDHLADERNRNPDPVRMDKLSPYPPEPDRRRHTHKRAKRQHRRQQHNRGQTVRLR